VRGDAEQAWIRRLQHRSERNGGDGSLLSLSSIKTARPLE
jgi:hypothetical protein